MQKLMIATGIECSYPTVEKGKRRDQLAETGHYDRWREDLCLCKELGARVIRYGPPYYRIHAGPDKYDWEPTDMVLPVLRELGLVPILDLCHFGVPDWAGDFQNTDWPELFADFAEAFARRYPWIGYYTPVNEIFVCARFSGKEGIWNEQKTSDKAMVRAHANQCKATLLAIERILKVRPDAVFFQNETAEVFLERWPQTRDEINLRNQMRFITFDFLYGHPPGAEVAMFVMDNGATEKQYRWFMEQGRRLGPHCVMGMDYYAANESFLKPDGSKESVGPVLGWHTIAMQYYQRYHKPMMLTETNAVEDGSGEGADWLWNIWHNVEHLRRDGVPVIGLTWYSLQDQVD